MTEPSPAQVPTARPPVARLVVWLAPLLVLAVALHAVDIYPVGVAYDDAVYVAIAKALATGRGYRYLHLPGTPFAAHFPPGYPFFLSLLWRLAPAFPANVLLFKVANAALVAVAAVWLARLARERFALTAPQAAHGLGRGRDRRPDAGAERARAVGAAVPRRCPPRAAARRARRGGRAPCGVARWRRACWPGPRRSYARTAWCSSPPWCCSSSSHGGGSAMPSGTRRAPRSSSHPGSGGCTPTPAGWQRRSRGRSGRIWRGGSRRCAKEASISSSVPSPGPYAASPPCSAYSSRR